MVKQKLREGVAIIHIAAHGSADGGQIALGPSTPAKAGYVTEEQDYVLTMREVQEIGVRAQLVVLSCCYSGRGEIKSEGIVGMSRAFLAAGARAVVASLWDVDDDATLSFMVSFYTYLKMGESASKSLQKAMKEIREEGYVKLRHWAPFFLIGDDVTFTLLNFS
jgi:CHAT domain-containing protein